MIGLSVPSGYGLLVLCYENIELLFFSTELLHGAKKLNVNFQDEDGWEIIIHLCHRVCQWSVGKGTNLHWVEKGWNKEAVYKIG